MDINSRKVTYVKKNNWRYQMEAYDNAMISILFNPDI